MRDDGKPHTSFQLRRIELKEGQEAMLLKAGWIFDGPANHKDTGIGRYWINPRSQRRYTKQGAVDIEELRESGEKKEWDGENMYVPTSPRAQLSPEDLKEILSARGGAKSIARLVKKFKVSRSTIERRRAGK